MDLDQLADLGKFIGGVGSAFGAVAVLATLIYLALQVRHSIQTSRVASFRSAKENFNHLNSMLAATPELGDLWLKGVQDFEGLGPGEQLRFGSFLSCYFNLFETLFEESRDGFASAQWKVEEGSMRTVLGMPGVRVWWRHFPLSYSREFRNHVDRLLDEIPPQEGTANQVLMKGTALVGRDEGSG